MLEIDIDKLEVLAKEATPGPWIFDPESADEWGAIVNSEKHAICEFLGEQTTDVNGRFIAAANPAAIQELINRLRDATSYQFISKAAFDVTEERSRQVEKLGYDHRNDDVYNDNELVHAALWFITADDLQWPWSWSTMLHAKSKRHDKRARLVRAAALLIAEIERIDRATNTQSGSSIE